MRCPRTAAVRQELRRHRLLLQPPSGALPPFPPQPRFPPLTPRTAGGLSAPSTSASSDLKGRAPQVWTRLECDAVESAVPDGASALVSSAGQAYEESTLASYSYGDEAGSDTGADGETTDVTQTVVIIGVGVAFALAAIALLAMALCFRRRALACQAFQCERQFIS